MAAEKRLLVMPKLGLTMTEGKVASWELAEGQRFEGGAVVAVIEGEKTAFDLEAPAGGTLTRILIPVSETVPVGTLLARWQLDGDEAGAAETAAEAPASAPRAAAAPAAGALRTAPAPAGEGTARLLATPFARRLAREAGLDPRTLRGSGPRNRIQAVDVEAAVAAAAARPRSEPAAPRPAAVAPTAGAVPRGAGDQLRAPTSIERTMAARVTAAKRDIPHFYLSVDIDAGPLLTLRASLNKAGGSRVSVTHLLVAAMVQALRAVPRMNTVWSEDGFVQYERIDVGIAVDTERGLMSPVARDLGSGHFRDIVAKVDDVVSRARAGKVRPDDHGGGAITISNAGMHRLHYMGSIIVPGQSAILGVGSVQECFRPDAAGSPTPRRELGMVLSVDHRVHTGVGALAFLAALEKAVVDPVQLLL